MAPKPPLSERTTVQRVGVGLALNGGSGAVGVGVAVGIFEFLSVWKRKWINLNISKTKIL